jgi:hypothetical protein
MIIIRGNGRNYVKRMVNEYQSAAEIIAEVLYPFATLIIGSSQISS